MVQQYQLNSIQLFPFKKSLYIQTVMQVQTNKVRLGSLSLCQIRQRKIRIRSFQKRFSEGIARQEKLFLSKNENRGKGLNIQWAPLNGITDNRINRLMASNLSRMTSPKLLFHTQYTFQLIPLLESVGYWNQFVSVPK